MATAQHRPASRRRRGDRSATLPLQHLIVIFLFFLGLGERGHFKDGIQPKML
jgi:hypothetical protein